VIVESSLDISDHNPYTLVMETSSYKQQYAALASSRNNQLSCVWWGHVSGLCHRTIYEGSKRFN